MSISNSILKLLNMKDPNLIFDENFLEERIVDGKKCLIIKGYLSNEFEFCPKCGCLNIETITKKGTKRCSVKITKISEMTAYLELKKQMYKCKNCKRKIIAQTPIVDYRCRISNNVKMAVINYAKEIMPKTLIGKLLNISDNTVQNIFNKVFSNDKLYRHFLPEAICIDEFTFMKKHFAFNICDARTGKTVDVVLDRTTNNLDKYFSYYTQSAKKKVKFVIVDMYSPYITLIKKHFPNAIIIIDLFHIVQLLTKSLNKTRIEVMKENTEDRNKFKKYWKLVLKSRFDLDNGKWKKFRCFKNLMTEGDIVNYLLQKNELFKNSYNLYQDILYYLQSRNYDGLKRIFSRDYDNISSKMNKTLNTLKKYLPYIENTLKYPFSNGVMERNNNTCKLLKRISFGYTNFMNMKSRIILITKIFRKEKREYQTKYSIPQYS